MDKETAQQKKHSQVFPSQSYVTPNLSPEATGSDWRGPLNQKTNLHNVDSTKSNSSIDILHSIEHYKAVAKQTGHKAHDESSLQCNKVVREFLSKALFYVASKDLYATNIRELKLQGQFSTEKGLYKDCLKNMYVFDILLRAQRLLDLKYSTLFLTKYLYIFCSNLPNLALFTCLYLAMKFEEMYPQEIEEIIETLGLKIPEGCTKAILLADQIIGYETPVLNSLTGCLQRPQLHECLEIVLCHLEPSEEMKTKCNQLAILVALSDYHLTNGSALEWVTWIVQIISKYLRMQSQFFAVSDITHVDSHSPVLKRMSEKMQELYKECIKKLEQDSKTAKSGHYEYISELLLSLKDLPLQNSAKKR